MQDLPVLHGDQAITPIAVASSLEDCNPEDTSKELVTTERGAKLGKNIPKRAANHAS